MTRAKSGNVVSRAAVRPAAVAMTVLISLLLAVVQTAPVANAAPGDPATSPALVELSACLADKKQGDLVLLMDTSGSLSEGDKATDPDGVRVVAAEVLLDQLALAQAKSHAAIDVAMLGFDSDVDTVTDFTPLTTDTLPDLKQSVELFRDKKNGYETDFWTALDTLSETMAKKAADRSSCQFFIWFTDGQFSLSSRDTVGSNNPDPPRTDSKEIPGHEGERLTADNVEAIERAGVDDICRGGGIADRLRLAGITTIAVGLSSTAGGAEPPDFSLLQRITENNTGVNCGDQPANGLFVGADSLSSLVLAFADIFSDGRIDQLTPTPICPVNATVDCGVTFPLSDALSRVHLTATVDNNGALVPAGGLAMELSGPSGGQPLSIPGSINTPTDGAVGAIAVRSHWYAEGPLTLDLSKPADASWAGTWTMKFIDVSGENAGAMVNVHLVVESDLMAVPLPAPGDWRAGTESPSTTVQLQQLDGTPITVTPALQDVIAVTTELVPLSDPSRKLTNDAPPGTPFTFDIPADFPTSAAQLQTRLTVTLPDQPPYPDVLRQADVDILPPLGSPSVSPPGQSLDFGEIEGTQTATAVVSVAGPNDGDGCAWVAGGDVQVHAKDVSAEFGGTAKASDSCLLIPAGQTVQLPVTLTPTAESNYLLQGAVSIALAPAGDLGRVTQSQVDFTAATIRTPDTAAKLWVFIVVMLLGILIPLLAFWWFRRFGARFASGDPLSAIVFGAEMNAGTLTGPGRSELVLPTDGWLAVREPVDGRRTLQLPGAVLRAHAGWRLTEPGYAMVDGDDVGVSGTAPHFNAKNGRPVVPLAVQGSWFVLAPRAVAASAAPEVPVRVVLVVSAQLDIGKRRELLAAAVTDAPAIFAAARRAAAGAAGQPGPDGATLASVGAPPSAANPFGDQVGGVSPAAGAPQNPFGDQTGGTYPAPGGTYPAGGTSYPAPGGPSRPAPGDPPPGTDDPWGHLR